MATYTSLIEMLLLVVVFVTTIGIIGLNLNSIYSQDKDLTFGLQTNNTQKALENLQSNFQNSTNEGQSSMTDYGIFKLATLPGIVFSIMSTLFNFITGGFINTIVYMMNLGAYSAMIIVFLRSLFIIGVFFIFIKIITRSPV